MNLVESIVYENEDSAGKSPVYFLVYRDKVRHPSTVKLWMQVWKKVRDINDLQHQIIEAIYAVTLDMLVRTWQEIEYRLDIVHVSVVYMYM